MIWRAIRSRSGGTLPRHASWALIGLCILVGLACIEATSPTPTPATESRESRIPAHAVKMSPETDETPPLMRAGDFEAPIPLPGKVNTAGAEDSPFITGDGQTLYFFFTPDVSVPVERQILDGVTGIYVSHQVNGEWDKPTRIMLQEAGELSLDGCEFVLDRVM